MNAVARDRAADRGCTGGGEVADDVGPPGEIPRGFRFLGRRSQPRPGGTRGWMNAGTLALPAFGSRPPPRALTQGRRRRGLFLLQNVIAPKLDRSPTHGYVGCSSLLGSGLSRLQRARSKRRAAR